MPINFNKKNRTFPFKIFANLQNKKLYVSVEKLSILYDYFNDKVIEIKNIGKFLPSPSQNYIGVKISIELTQKGTVITNAEIILSNDPDDIQYDSLGYLKKTTVLIGTVYLANEKISISQRIATNLTKYSCGIFISKIL